MLSRCVRIRLSAALGAVAASLVLGGPARSEEGAERAPRKEPRTVLFGSVDAGRSAFSGSGIKRTLAGPLDRSGPVAMLTVGGGTIPERSDEGDRLTRTTAQGSLGFGYQWALDRVFVTLLAGPEVDYEGVGSAAFAAGKTARPRYGGRVQGEVWSHPTDATLLTATLIGGTARGHLWGRVAGGYKVWRDVFVGPEVAHYRTDTYADWRLGVHATGFEVKGYSLRLSGGWRWDSDTGRDGGYVGLMFHTKR